MKEMKREKESGRKNPVDSQRTKNEERESSRKSILRPMNVRERDREENLKTGVGYLQRFMGLYNTCLLRNSLSHTTQPARFFYGNPHGLLEPSISRAILPFFLESYTRSHFQIWLRTFSISFQYFFLYSFLVLYELRFERERKNWLEEMKLFSKN